jgi:GT2 family glycosyltransferase
MTPRELFDEVGGLSLQFPLRFNDVDDCLKLRSLGQRVVYDPETVPFHGEQDEEEMGLAAHAASSLGGRRRLALLASTSSSRR